MCAIYTLYLYLPNVISYFCVMAELRFDFIGVDKGLKSSIDAYKKNINELKKSFTNIGKGIDTNTLKTQIDNQRLALVDARVEVQNTIKAGKDLDNQYKATRNSTASITEETKRYTLEQKKLRDEIKNSYSNSPYGKLTKELTEVRNEAKNVGAEMYRMAQAGDTTSAKYLELGNRFTQLSSRVTTLDTGIKKIDGSLGQYQRNVGNYAGKQANANGVALEFTRIIQDAPYGMMGIGNNIQQLTTNFGSYTDQLKRAAAEQGKTVSSMQIFKGVASSFLTTGNLIALGVAAITSGWTYYTMQQQKANKAAKDGGDAFNNFKDSLRGFQELQVKSISNYADETQKLENLVSIVKDASNSTKERTRALNQLQQLYPQVFKNVDLETFNNKVASSSYLELVGSINAAAKARAAYSKISELASKQLTLQYQKEQKQQEISDKQRQLGISNNAFNSMNPLDKVRTYAINSVQGALSDPWNAIKSIVGQGESPLQKMDNELGDIDKSLDDVNKQMIYFINASRDYEKSNTGIQEGLKNTTSASVKNLKEAFDYLSKIRDLIKDRQKDISLIDVKGQSKDLIELQYKWEDYFNTLSDLQKKLDKDLASKRITQGTYNTVKKSIDNANGIGDDLIITEQSDILKKYAKEREDIINEMNEKVGLIQSNAREKELAKFTKDLDDKIKLLVEKGATIQDAIKALLPAREQMEISINFKYEDIQVDKLNQEMEKSFTRGTVDNVQKQLTKRLDTVKKYVTEISKLRGVDFDEEWFNNLSKELEIKANLSLDTKKAQENVKEYVNIADQGLQTLFSSLNTNVKEFGLGLSSVLFSIGDTFKNVIDGLNANNKKNFMDNLLKPNNDGVVDLKDNWKKITEDSTKMNQAVGVALSSVGSLVSNITSQTSVAGQGIGGALSGAGSMAATGNPWLIGAGALIGGLSGIFGAKRARKQERLQREQLAEQKKANALLERMNALTYASSIIGGRTEYGVVSGVNRNEFGEVTFRIQGKDLVASLDRTQQQSNR